MKLLKCFVKKLVHLFNYTCALASPHLVKKKWEQGDFTEGVFVKTLWKKNRIIIQMPRRKHWNTMCVLALLPCPRKKWKKCRHRGGGVVVGTTLWKQKRELIQKFSRKSGMTKYSVYTQLSLLLAKNGNKKTMETLGAQNKYNFFY